MRWGCNRYLGNAQIEVTLTSKVLPLPLSVSGSVIQSVSDSFRLEIAIASPSLFFLTLGHPWVFVVVFVEI